MSLAFAFWGWLSTLVLLTAVFCTVAIIVGFFSGSRYRKTNAGAIVLLMAITPFIYMLGIFLWNIANGVR